MKTEVSPDNPHGYNLYGYAWQHVPNGSLAHLDFGCHHGRFLETLRSKGIPKLVGVDISQDAVGRARELYPDLEIIHVTKTAPLPFADGLFTSITILDVVEHVDEQAVLMNALNRILTNDGLLIITLPGRNIFSFLDTGNLKFVFPKLHRWYYCRKHSVAEYEQRYVSNPDGLVGDISSKKGWHEHFSRKKLKGLLDGWGFVVAGFDGTGLFGRIINCLGLLFRGFPLLVSLIDKIRTFDAKWFSFANLFCVAAKPAKVQY